MRRLLHFFCSPVRRLILLLVLPLGVLLFWASDDRYRHLQVWAFTVERYPGGGVEVYWEHPDRLDMEGVVDSRPTRTHFEHRFLGVRFVRERLIAQGGGFLGRTTVYPAGTTISWTVELDLWLLTVLAGLPLALYAVHLYRNRLPPPGCCRQCGYDLRGNPAAKTCPECGEATSPGTL